ncbi:O-antigen ligase family protein [Kineosporia babensis]|uniref:Uncharacterized protein n=1 Tax=Kineosporia babensis TaxID=499548 RepID=A0A9X1SUR0_9ACTN|nr:hypothetical protein [Kineosporia babensis]MCD5312716.1 hypothetical protein [Kineosporia babensis]
MAFYPNSLALYLGSAVPVAAFLLRRKRLIILAAPCLVSIWAGLLASDSRIGIASAVIATVLIPFLAGKKASGTTIVIGFIGVCLTAPLIVQAIAWVAANTRLAPGAGSGSDFGRQRVNEQSMLDFLHSPVFGIGFEFGGGGISVPLGILSASGLLGAAGVFCFLAWWAGSARAGWADPDIRIVVVMTLVILAVMCYQNNLVDRGQYLPLLLTVLWARHFRAPSLDSVPAPPTRSSRTDEALSLSDHRSRPPLTAASPRQSTST